ncbi:hypothetical protein KL86DPRO_60248 [uncultured delta proteobacterium]|uniref:Flavodoxin-like domain-containing protein n=1 Tax=uncultured delta proteobacterium TaxID=34034 RepID=A0A212KG90_9DELT|nr:hypothetical protein KL86DPRO_60248 [uncultured delta proteobacterium]
MGEGQSHGAIWRDNPLQIVKKYTQWAKEYQEDQITIIYDTMWEGTTKIAHAIAKQVNTVSPDTVVKVFNVSKTDKNEIMTEVFKSRAIAVGSPTVSNSILCGVAGWLHFLKSLKFKNRGFKFKVQHPVLGYWRLLKKLHRVS